jgi:hypothetical protein
LAALPTSLSWPLGWQARALVKTQQLEAALACAELALSRLKASGGYTMDLPVPPIAQIEALQALGRHEDAQEASKSAKRRLLRRLERIEDPRLRAHFTAHPENALILSLPD